MQVSSTSTFRESLQELCRRVKHKYTSCPQDICAEFIDKSVEELLSTNNAILNDDGIKCTVKIRLGCESRNTGKSGGFRLIAIIDRQKQQLIMLEVYPKVGPKGKSNISKLELGVLLKTYLTERDNGDIVEHNIKNDLAIITQEEKDIPINLP